MTINIKDYEFYYKLRKLPFVEEIWLFGSRSKGSDRERSDIDIAIVCPDATPQDWEKVLEIVDTADTLFKIDCVRLDKLDTSVFKKQIQDNKQVLFKRVKNNYEWYESFLDVGEALEKYQDSLSYDRLKFPRIVEATIQVFEYTFELYWKLLKKICLAEEGIDTNSPRSTLQAAHNLSFISAEQEWIQMMKYRNLSSHIYDMTVANELYTHCQQYYTILNATYEKLRTRFGL